jgi:hypothetical protein
MPHSFNKIWIHAIWATKKDIQDSIDLLSTCAKELDTYDWSFK